MNIYKIKILGCLGLLMLGNAVIEAKNIEVMSEQEEVIPVSDNTPAMLFDAQIVGEVFMNEEGGDFDNSTKAAEVFSRTLPFEEYCRLNFHEAGECPTSICQLACLGDHPDKGCELRCLPQFCVDIDADECPLEYCQLMDGCNKQKVCYYQMDEPFGCGEENSASQRVECCEGLSKRCGVEFFDGTCDMLGEYSINTVPICVPCGNGVCSQFENRCNCPEDCH